MTQQSQQTPFGVPPFDPAAMQAMWQQMMSQFSPGAAPQTPPTSMPAEALKQMQKAYLDAMGRWADEYMRSPQFLDQMKQSLEGALAMRRQVEDFIRKASEQSYGSKLGMYDAVGAVRDAESWITRRLDELATRLEAIEGKLDGRGDGASARRGSKTKAPPRSATAKKSSKRSATKKPAVSGKKKAR